jgi:hypothetical protein
LFLPFVILAAIILSPEAIVSASGLRRSTPSAPVVSLVVGPVLIVEDLDPVAEKLLVVQACVEESFDEAKPISLGFVAVSLEMPASVTVGTLARHTCIVDPDLLAKHGEEFRNMKLEDELGVKGTCLDPFRVLGIVVVANSGTKELQPANDVQGSDVGVLQHGNQYFVADFGFRNVVEAKNASEEEVWMSKSGEKEMEVWSWMDFSELYRVFELVGDSEASAWELPVVVYFNLLEVALEDLCPD